MDQSKQNLLKTRFLIVDDAASVRKVVRLALTDAGFLNFTEATDGDSAWNLLTESKKTDRHFEMIICDWDMPHMTGIELLEKVRQDDVYKAIPFLMATAEGNKEQILAAIKLGCSGYLMKPFQGLAVKDRVKKILQKQLGKIAA